MSSSHPWSLPRRGGLLPLAALAACGGDWSEYEPQRASLPDDTVKSVSYPAGPYGTKVGQVVENIDYTQAFFDPDTLCKKGEDLDLKLTQGVRSLSFLDIIKGNPFCPAAKKKFLVVISSAGW